MFQCARAVMKVKICSQVDLANFPTFHFTPNYLFTNFLLVSYKSTIFSPFWPLHLGFTYFPSKLPSKGHFYTQNPFSLLWNPFPIANITFPLINFPISLQNPQNPFILSFSPPLYLIKPPISYFPRKPLLTHQRLVRLTKPRHNKT